MYLKSLDMSDDHTVGKPQDYAPFRQLAIDSSDLARLSNLRPMIVARDTILLWLEIILAWTICAIWTEWWIVLGAIPLIGTRIYALFIIGHDGIHRRLFYHVRANDLWNDLFILGSVGLITRINRANHIHHHWTLGRIDDPDRYKYTHAGRETSAMVFAKLTGLPFLIRAIENVFKRSAQKPPVFPTNRTRGYIPRDILIIFSWQFALIAGLSAMIGWWAFFVLWIIPVYVFAYTADISRVFFEHSCIEDDAVADRKMRLITYYAPYWERVILAPMNMNYHAAQHLWPSVPYYNLAKADHLLRTSLCRDYRLVWRRSYLVYLVTYLRSLPARRLQAIAKS